ncbi:MAG: formylglycine-generating enzyme family protein [Prevotellaceae bacterium]|jgi:formylglycine-generating enzyme required for sulfatase activity|nr:formylglycine-generating enzyme family protein [Prevotellaceae bacterium]
MKQNYKIYLVALLLVGATGMMTARAQGSGKPTLAVFVVGMDNTLGNSLAQQIGAELNRNSRYTVATSDAAVQAKLTELRAAHTAGNSIDRNALAAWGHDNGISTICLVTDAIKGSDHMFYAHLIDAKDSKVSGRGSYIRTGVTTTDLPRVSLALSRQLDGPERRRSTPAPTRSYPAELDIEMVRVEGGTFTMGCTAEQVSSGCKPTTDLEYPHSVTVSTFYIGKYEITRAQWKAVMKDHPTLANPGQWSTDDQLPIESVSWFDIDTAFLPRLNALTKKNYRLPREAEWEYAARGCKGDGNGGTATCENLMYYSGNYDISELGWYGGNSQGRTYIVGGMRPNGLGIYDILGNIWEWCRDSYSSTYYKSSAGATNPENASVGSTARITRGCCWYSGHTTCRFAYRNSTEPITRGAGFGFRVVLPAQ